jgi:hypothetical protein
MDELASTFTERVEAFLDQTGLAPSKFGADACGDPNFVADLRAGMEPRSARRRKVEEFMTRYCLPGSAPSEPNAAPEADPSKLRTGRAA